MTATKWTRQTSTNKHTVLFPIFIDVSFKHLIESVNQRCEIEENENNVQTGTLSINMTGAGNVGRFGDVSPV